MPYDGHVFMDIVRGILSIFTHKHAETTTAPDALATGIEALETVKEKFDLYKDDVELFLSNEADSSIEEVESIVDTAIADLKAVDAGQDPAALIDDVKLSDDPKKDAFYKNLLKQGVVIYQDKKIEISEIILFTVTIVSYIKSK